METTVAEIAETEEITKRFFLKYERDKHLFIPFLFQISGLTFQQT